MNQQWWATWEGECNCGWRGGGNGTMKEARKWMKKHARTCEYKPYWNMVPKTWWERLLDKMLGQGSM